MVAPWFEDSDTRRFLGGPDWPRRMLDIGTTQIGSEFRGAVQTGAHRWLAWRHERPVGYVDCGTFDRWTTCDQDRGGRVAVVETIDRPAAALGFVVAPAWRGRGIAAGMISALIANPALAEVEVFGAGVEPANIASLRCLHSAGFRLHADQPDWEGMLYLLLQRRERSGG